MKLTETIVKTKTIRVPGPGFPFRMKEDHDQNEKVENKSVSKKK